MNWQPIATAPRDGTPVLLLTIEGLPERVARFAGIQFIGRNTGDYAEWSFAAPAGAGGIPDEWLAGWQPLPAPPEPAPREGV